MIFLYQKPVSFLVDKYFFLRCIACLINNGVSSYRLSLEVFDSGTNVDTILPLYQHFYFTFSAFSEESPVRIGTINVCDQLNEGS